MLPYALIDLHCDTLTALTAEDAPLLDAFRDPARRGEAAAAPAGRVRETNTLDLPGRHFSLSAIPKGVNWCQCCAIFVPDELKGEEAAVLAARLKLADTVRSVLANGLNLLGVTAPEKM